MVTGYPGQSGPPWPGELVIGSTITYGEEGEKVSPYGSVVGEWAYIKELATMNTRERGRMESIRLYVKGNVVRDRKGGASIVRR